LWSRFLKEARAQARIQHEHVCRVYDTGQADGEPYIAMQLIDGEPLGRAKDRMTLEQKVKVLCEVAAAVHEAHRTALPCLPQRSPCSPSARSSPGGGAAADRQAPTRLRLGAGPAQRRARPARPCAPPRRHEACAPRVPRWWPAMGWTPPAVALWRWREAEWEG
jgi:hypothetical protein